MSETRKEDGSAWRDLGLTCQTCGFNGKHLVVDGALYYCGRCKKSLE